ncbi:hypothetical protein AKJ09_10324 [Labilithrix luteola]|uniref:Phospholipid-binding protein n=1 Tax=Labilithrix luteola TaxID=1391654 RepID=A0A0K1QD00_9BACT|nr:hypothetical protein AKJ09_10324 [Labilithrix luteola]
MLTLGIVALGGCTKPPLAPRLAAGVGQAASITVTSPAFGGGKAIPIDNTCDGKDLFPELVISSPPDGTKSLLVIVEDPDTSSGTFTHMVAFGLSPELRKIPGGETLAGAGDDARYGLNDYQSVRYAGPCPPHGEMHRYQFRVIALDTMPKIAEGAPRARVDEAIDGHILGEGVLTGTFGH